MQQDALREQQLAAGAVFSSNGCLPEHFGDPQAEFAAAGTHNLVFDVSDRSQIELTGRDRVAFLNNFCTNDLSVIPDGSGCETFLTNVKGRVLAHGFLFVARESLWLETVAGQTAGMMAHLDRYLIREDVELRSQTEQQAQLLILCQTECRIPGNTFASDGQRFEHSIGDFQGSRMRVHRVPFGTATGLLLAVDRTALAELWASLCQSGCRPAGTQAWHAVRISAGFPQYGLDITDDNLAQEVGRTQQCISFSKGCYLGQEPIARIDAMGHVNRELKALKLSHGPAPAAGSLIFSETSSAPLGAVTSSSDLSLDGSVVALGYLKTGAGTPGHQVRVQIGDTEIDAVVIPPVT
ncbi:MAG: hypothetical protein ABGZ17_08250 [Planctomycetaceae bacterium]